jgi:hypothetical protein
MDADVDALEGDLRMQDYPIEDSEDGEPGVATLVKELSQGRWKDTDNPWPQSEEEWLEQQRNDQYCAILLEKIQESQHRVYLGRDADDCFYRDPMKNGKLGPVRRRYFTETQNTHHQVVSTKEIWREQIVVPSNLIRQCIAFHHEGLAHPGRTRTIQAVQSRYYWPTIRRDCTNYLHQCHYCDARKAFHRRPKIPVQSYDKPVRPFYRMHMDLTGKLNSTKDGMQYILVFKCAMTKWVEIFALMDKSAEEVVKCLRDEVIMRHGAPAEIITDRGNEFFNTTMAQIVKLLAIPRHVKTTAYNPRSDGMAEKQMSTLKDQLVAFTNKYQRDWDEHLALIAGMYRMTVNAATGYSPFFLLYGREPEMPHDTHIREIAEKDDLVQYVKGMTEVMQDVWSGVSTRVLHNTQEFNKIPREPLRFKPYKVGEYFMLKCHPKRYYIDTAKKEKTKILAKLQYRWVGPYRITRVLSPVLYEAFVHGRIIRVHAVNMKPKTETWSDEWMQADEGIRDEQSWSKVLKKIFERSNEPRPIDEEGGG